MASSKTTVLGLRLDHERRAWVEDEAARQGVTVRALFEHMIDEARYEEALEDAALDIEQLEADVAVLREAHVDSGTRRLGPALPFVSPIALTGEIMHAARSAGSFVVRTGTGCLVQGAKRSGLGVLLPCLAKERRPS